MRTNGISQPFLSKSLKNTVIDSDEALKTPETLILCSRSSHAPGAGLVVDALVVV